VHDLLCSVWREATAWLVGRYVIMPDHVHLFAAPGDIELGKACSPVDVGSAGASPSHGVLGAGGPSDVGSAGASPSRGEPIEVDLDGWVTYWKSQFTKAWGRGPRLWQPRQWDTRLRVGESYESKWDYVRHNPVRHGLVARPEHWPYQGEIFPLDWREPVR